MSLDPTKEPQGCGVNQNRGHVSASDGKHTVGSHSRTDARSQTDGPDHPHSWGWLHLTANERVLWSGRPSRLPLIPTFLLTGIVIAGVSIVFAVGGPAALFPVPNMTITDWKFLAESVSRFHCSALSAS